VAGNAAIDVLLVMGIIVLGLALLVRRHGITR
jgi:hypothetical protein